MNNGDARQDMLHACGRLKQVLLRTAQCQLEGLVEEQAGVIHHSSFISLFSLRGPVQIVVPMQLPCNTQCKKHVISQHSTLMPPSRQVKRRNGFHSN